MIQPDIAARLIGHEQQPIVVIDGFHPDPQQLCVAVQSTPFAPAHRHYPGIRAPLPPDYFAQVHLPLMSALIEVFGHAGAIDLIDASFSIVTTPPADLTIEQRPAHFDAVQPNRIAIGQEVGEHHSINADRAIDHWRGIDQRPSRDGPGGWCLDSDGDRKPVVIWPTAVACPWGIGVGPTMAHRRLRCGHESRIIGELQ